MSSVVLPLEVACLEWLYMSGLSSRASKVGPPSCFYRDNIYLSELLFLVRFFKTLAEDDAAQPRAYPFKSISQRSVLCCPF